MRLYSENENYKLYQGNMLDMLEVIEPNSIDSIVTDPPYELNFMGKGWDNSGIAFQPDTWKKCYEVLKSGGYLLAFGGSRTFHRIACAIEDAGFEIRDTICWMYGSGFPKSMNIGLAIDKKNGKDTMKKEYEERIATNEWQGWGTALKPSFEPIIVARKPFKGSLVDNVIEYGVGGINIDECRVEHNGENLSRPYNEYKEENLYGKYEKRGNPNNISDKLGRFPANTILTYDETDYDEVCGGFPYCKNGGKKDTIRFIKNTENKNCYGDYKPHYSKEIYGGDSGSASRYFYCAKASKKDRDEGLSEFADKVKVFNGKSDISSIDMKDVEQRFTTVGKNTHPTVKPCDLMQYLVRLVTPNGGTVLDPFNGSGSTGKAVMYENHERNKNYKYVGIELTEEYLPISKARIEYVCNLPKEQKQSTIFDYLEDE